MIETLIAIETSTEVCSAALLHRGEVLSQCVNQEGSNHAALLGGYVEDMLREAERWGIAVEAVALSAGPGSYTGLRIGAALAKGLCYGLDIPLIAVPTLTAIVEGAASEQSRAARLFCPMIDARRMEVYCALYDAEGKALGEAEPMIITEQSFADELREHTIAFCGNGAAKCKTVLTHPNALFVEGVVPTAAAVGLLAARGKGVQFIEGKEIAYFEPNYVKAFVPAPAHVKGLK